MISQYDDFNTMFGKIHKMKMLKQILKSTKKVNDKSVLVELDFDRIVEVSKEISAYEITKTSSNLNAYEWDKKEIIWIIFLFNCINYCYWPNEGQKKWGFGFAGNHLLGSIGLFRAIEFAVKKRKIKLKTQWLEDINEAQFKDLLGKEKNLPMIQERVNHWRIAGKILRKKFNGSPVEIIKKAENSTENLTKELGNTFSFFCDVTMYKNTKVWFLKRAQLVAKMLYDYFGGKELGYFNDMDNLTLLADYRLPQILNTLGILKYKKRLEKKILLKKEISKDSEEEVEIRAATIQAGEMMKREINKGKSKVNSTNIDTYLWLKSKTMKMKLPHHQTRTIFY